MNEKYFLYVEDDLVLGIKYNCGKEEIHIGGFTRFRSTIEQFLTSFFGVDYDEAERRLTQRNKVRYIAPLDENDFTRGCEKLRSAGFVLENTSNLERVMR